MPDFPCFFLTDILPAHLVIGPESAVHHQAIDSLHGREHMRFYFTQARRIIHFFAGGDLFDYHADIIAVMRIVAVRRIGRRFAFQGMGIKTQIIDAGNAKAAAINRQG